MHSPLNGPQSCQIEGPYSAIFQSYRYTVSVLEVLEAFVYTELRAIVVRLAGMRTDAHRCMTWYKIYFLHNLIDEKRSTLFCLVLISDPVCLFAVFELDHNSLSCQKKTIYSSGKDSSSLSLFLAAPDDTNLPIAADEKKRDPRLIALVSDPLVQIPSILKLWMMIRCARPGYFKSTLPAGFTFQELVGSPCSLLTP